jgi:S-adenosylmethionine-diacylglycerol 3-amino-3-carboxypropyl transferase
MRLRDRINRHVFQFVHGKNLVYNTCWEDPRLDRVALELSPSDRIVMITSAGCNALDYALQAPAAVHCVDMNFRQNALLDLKIAGIRSLEYGEFWEMFGRGRLPNHQQNYTTRIRPLLPETSRRYWDKHIRFFNGRGWCDSFYFCGTSGKFARMVNSYVDKVARVRPDVERLLNARSIDEQRELYFGKLRGAVWTRFIRWAVGRDATLSLLGVPLPQRRQVERGYPGGIVQFIEDCLESVFTRLPIHDNYFWRVYMTGEYTPECCPEYLKPENFAALKGGLVDRVSTHTCTILQFLRQSDVPVTRYVLLDHMDWLSTHRFLDLQEEWQAILDRAAPKARILWRSGGLQTDFVDRVQATVNGRPIRVGEILKFNTRLASELHAVDRVHTYGSFYIADFDRAAV